jgi:uncharacterized protein YdcH (DUF465 family)
LLKSSPRSSSGGVPSCLIFKEVPIMEKNQIELIRKYAQENMELALLWEEHKKLDDEIARREIHSFGPTLESELKDLKLKKLHGKEKIVAILDTYTD